MWSCRPFFLFEILEYEIMDENNLKSWALQPDVCRCCLSTNGTCDLTASYVINDKKEVYSDMIADCFGISISHTTEWGPSRMICNLCIEHLRDAWSFKRQVIIAEKTFDKYYSIKTGTQEVSVKIENEDVEDVLSDAHYDEVPVKMENEVCNVDGVFSVANLDEINKDPMPKVKIKNERRTKSKRARAKTRTETETHALERDGSMSDDSDVPIAKMSKSKHGGTDDNTQNGGEIVSGTPLLDVKLNGTVEKINGQPLRKATKQLSERKRVKITCDIILNFTSACPFRHHKSWFQCFYCFQDCMDIDELRKHTAQNHRDVEQELKKVRRYPRSLQIDISLLQCNKCSINIQNIDSLKKHLQSTHNKVIYPEFIADYKVNKSPYFCHLCGNEFHVFRSLTMHLNEHYANCICDVCGKSFINNKRLKVHKHTHEIGSFPCAQCGKILKNKMSEINHVRNVHSKRDLKCQICFKPVKHYNDRIKHMSLAHNITHKFKCPICPQVYNIKHYLAAHVRQTHGNKNKKCTECHMAFRTNYGLKKHMLIHTGKKPFKCNVCCKSYARSYTLKEHMKGHV